MTPDDLAKSGTEHGHQRAFFAWCNMAANFGFRVADEPDAYASKEAAELAWRIAGEPACIEYLPLIHAIHNQGHGDQVRGSRARAEGVKAGIPDIFWPFPRREYREGLKVFPNYAGLYIELKRPKTGRGRAGKSSDVQDQVIDDLRRLGYCVVVAVGWREAANAVRDYYSGKI